jgi:hypothetical protein
MGLVCSEPFLIKAVWLRVQHCWLRGVRLGGPLWAFLTCLSASMGTGRYLFVIWKGLQNVTSSAYLHCCGEHLAVLQTFTLACQNMATYVTFHSGLFLTISRILRHSTQKFVVLSLRFPLFPQAIFVVDGAWCANPPHLTPGYISPYSTTYKGSQKRSSFPNSHMDS